MANDDNDSLRAARPRISLAGNDEPALAAGLITLLIVETTQGLYRCEATFGNWGEVDGAPGFLYFDRRKIDFGKALQIKKDDELLFDGRITAIEARFPSESPPEIVVLAEDRFQDLRMTRRTRTFADQSDSAVMQQIASDHGLSPSVTLSGPSHKVLAQVNQSDLAFLRDRARAVGAELWMDDRTLYAKARDDRSGTPKRLGWKHELREYTVLADLAGQRSAVVASGWDVAGKQALSYEATESVISGEVSGDSSGASILSSALGDRKEGLAHAVPLTRQETQARAEAYYKQTARRFLVGHGVAETSGDLRVGKWVDLQGLGPLFSGRYYLAEVHHLFDGAGGLRTEFTAERAGLGQAR